MVDEAGLAILKFNKYVHGKVYFGRRGEQPLPVPEPKITSLEEFLQEESYQWSTDVDPTFLTFDPDAKYQLCLSSQKMY